MLRKLQVPSSTLGSQREDLLKKLFRQETNQLLNCSFLFNYVILTNYVIRNSRNLKFRELGDLKFRELWNYGTSELGNSLSGVPYVSLISIIAVLSWQVIHNPD